MSNPSHIIDKKISVVIEYFVHSRLKVGQNIFLIARTMWQHRTRFRKRHDFRLSVSQDHGL